MKLPEAYSPEQIAEMIGARCINKGAGEITGINEIHRLEPGDITFVDHPKYYDKALGSVATLIIIDKEVDCPDGKAILVTDTPFASYNSLTLKFSPFESASKHLSDSATIGTGTIIQPGVFVGNHVDIGKNCLIHPQVSIYDNTQIGDNVIIHSNTTVGSDAFYFNKKEDKYSKMHSCGRVIIHDDVEIGSGCTIDKGVSSDTIIGEGCKLDNMVHVGHGVVIGKNCLFAAQVAIGGKVNIGDNVILWGQVGVSKDLTIGSNTEVWAQSGIGKDLAPNTVWWGSPAGEAREKMKELVLSRKLPEIWAKMRDQ